ncbi:MAG: hypothetical protein ACI80V_003831, partial [Rhodothermales bacterium]
MQTSSLLEINLPAVLRNYFVVALRSMRHHPAFAAINIVGLSVSMAVGLVLILFL